MSKVFRLRSVQKIPVPLSDAWTFFSNPHNLVTITPSFLNLQVKNEVFEKEVYPGQVLLYTVKPLLGIPLEWMTEITHVEKEKIFVDEQRKGPYKLWHHQHHFKAISNGVEMTDIVHYRLPFGVLGSVAHALVIKNKLKTIFYYRYNKIIEMFGDHDKTGTIITMD